MFRSLTTDVMRLAEVAKRKDETLSRRFSTHGETVTMSMVKQFPPYAHLGHNSKKLTGKTCDEL